ncbi:hypothetical protein ACSMXM_03710 [Pacificimonas sp. ICDLI1SI03]
MKRLIWAAFIMAPYPALAQDSADHARHDETAATVSLKTERPDTRPILWEKVRADMTIDEVHALYPQDGKKVKWHGETQTEVEDVTVIDGCNAEVEIQHETGKVEAVKVKGRGSIAGRCSDNVFSALAGKYGQPSGTTQSRGSLFKRGGSTAVWSRDNVTMRYKWFDDNGIGGGGLGQASWELTYTGTTGDIAL